MTSSSEAGFTLFELLVAVAIVGMAVALFGGFATPAGGGAVNLAARDIAGALRSARAEAIAANRITAVAFDFASDAWRGTEGGSRRLPAGVRATLIADRGEALSGSAAQISFRPDGSSSGGRITFDGFGRTIAVGVDWLSGRVALVEAR